MAHAFPTSRKTRAAVAAAAALAWPATAIAVTLGEIEVRSRPGEALEARIAVAPGPGEVLEASCFRVARGPRAAGAFVTRARVALEEGAGPRFLVVRSVAPVTDPASILRLVVACPGPEVLAWRDYSRLFEARGRAASSPSAPSGTAPAATAGAGRGAGAPQPGLVALEGDTLESLATAIFPRNRRARSVYLEAMREDNPSLASLGDRDPIDPGTRVVLPDLRSFARGRPLGEDAPVATAPVSPPSAKPAPQAAPVTPPPAKAPSPAAMAAPKTPAPQPRAQRAAHSDAAFVLRLSAPEVDLSRSRGVDDRLRAQLRERLLVLDADDQVAALLSLRHSLKQLEGRVAELQLKLAGMPPSLQARAPVAEPAPPAQPQPAQPQPAQPQPAPPKAPEAAKPAPATSSGMPGTEPVSPAPAPEATPMPAPKAGAAKSPLARPAVPADAQLLPSWLWGVVALLVAIAAWIGWRLLRGRSEVPEAEARAREEPDSAILPATEESEGVDAGLEIAAALPEPRAPEPVPQPGRRVIASDADLATTVATGDPGDLRRRYLEQRFPEIANRTIVLDNPDSVVKGARLLYEDGALPRAVELLQFAIERDPAEVKTWLALFEIFRLEGLAGEFAALAERFRGPHGKGDYWHKVQYFGREIDPANALYREAPFDHLETIGPAGAKRLPAALTFDPLAENWLNAPMDFTDEVLANELRKSLMAQAGLTEQDLVPNPMPALRNVEMFTVA